MAKLYFRYGAMGASKTANLLMVAHNYESQGRTVVLIKPSADTRWSKDEIVSRAGGMKHKCLPVSPERNIATMLEALPEVSKLWDVACILVDEAQFLTTKQVQELASFVDDFNIPVICYGLKNSYKEGVLFEGSAALLYYADAVEEIKTICVFCHKKAIMNLRVVNGEPVYDGDLIKIGDTEISEEFYLPVCRSHYHSPETVKEFLSRKK